MMSSALVSLLPALVLRLSMLEGFGEKWFLVSAVVIEGDVIRSSQKWLNSNLKLGGTCGQACEEAFFPPSEEFQSREQSVCPLLNVGSCTTSGRVITKTDQMLQIATICCNI